MNGLRLLGDGDADPSNISALHARCFDDCWSAAYLSSLLAMPGCFAIVAGSPSNPEGFVLGRIAADEVEVLTLGVHPERRRHGIGGSLVDSAAAHAAALGAQIMFLEVGRSNTAARALYAARGFLSVGERRAYYATLAGSRDDAIILRASLPLEPLGKRCRLR